MADKDNSNQDTDGLQKNSYIWTLFTIILTALATAFFASCFNYNINQKLSREEYHRSIRDRQMDNISDIVRQVSKIQQLREKIYWAEFHYEISYINELTDNNSFREDSQRLDEYRVQYEEASSDFFAAFHLSTLLFDIDKDKIIELHNEISEKMGFGYDSEAIEDKWQELKSDGKTDIDALEELTKYAEDKYNDEFFQWGMQYSCDLEAIIETGITK